MVRKEKKEKVEKLAQEITDSEAVVFSDFSGLTVNEMSALRKKLDEMGADFKVVKNTLLQLALEKGDLSEGEELTGPTSALFSKEADPVESIKALASFLEEKGKGEIKHGFFEKAYVGAFKVKELATLPGREELRVMLVSHLSSPISGFVYALKNNQSKFVVALSEIAKAKGGEQE